MPPPNVADALATPEVEIETSARLDRSSRTLSSNPGRFARSLATFRQGDTRVADRNRFDMRTFRRVRARNARCRARTRGARRPVQCHRACAQCRDAPVGLHRRNTGIVVARRAAGGSTGRCPNRSDGILTSSMFVRYGFAYKWISAAVRPPREAWATHSSKKIAARPSGCGRRRQQDVDVGAIVRRRMRFRRTRVRTVDRESSRGFRTRRGRRARSRRRVFSWCGRRRAFACKRLAGARRFSLAVLFATL